MKETAAPRGSWVTPRMPADAQSVLGVPVREEERVLTILEALPDVRPTRHRCKRRWSQRRRERARTTGSPPSAKDLPDREERPRRSQRGNRQRRAFVLVVRARLRPCGPPRLRSPVEPVLGMVTRRQRWCQNSCTPKGCFGLKAGNSQQRVAPVRTSNRRRLEKLSPRTRVEFIGRGHRGVD